MKFKPGTILTLVSLSITLFLIGFYLLVMVHLSKLEDIVNEKTPFIIELQDSLAQPELFLINQELEDRSYVLNSSIEYITKEQGLKMLETQFGKEILNNESENPLSDIIKLKLNSDFIKEGGAKLLSAELEEKSAINHAYFEQQQFGQLKSNLRAFNRILLLTGLIFIAISILLIYNNLKLVLRSDRFMLKTMELVGASPSFIKMPYIKKSIQIGFLAALINVVIFVTILVFLNYRFELFNNFFDISLTIFVLVLIFFIGLFFPLAFSNMLVNNYIRMPESKRFL